MDDSLRIPVDRLRAVFELLMRHLTETEGESITLERDYFWSIAPDGLYDVYTEPGELGIGQLSESWEHLEELFDPDPATITFHLVWLADIIRALGHQETRTPPTA